MDKSAKIYIAGHKGLVGSAILKGLQQEGYSNLIYKTSDALDLTNQNQVLLFFKEEQPEYVFLAAAKVGGIEANNRYRGSFIYENLMIQTNVIHASYLYSVKKLLFLGSSCVYPKMAPQPIKEESLLTGPLESTNEPYAIAKIAGLKLCESYRMQYGCNFISVMPTNLYGTNDNFDLDTSHVIPALLRKFHEAKIRDLPSVEVWGTGAPKREFMHVDDLASACLFLMLNYDANEIINVGTGEELTIKALALLIKDIVGYKGDLQWNTTQPDGTPRKFLDTKKMNALGWRSSISLKAGLKQVYYDNL